MKLPIGKRARTRTCDSATQQCDVIDVKQHSITSSGTALIACLALAATATATAAGQTRRGNVHAVLAGRLTSQLQPVAASERARAVSAARDGVATPEASHNAAQ